MAINILLMKNLQNSGFNFIQYQRQLFETFKLKNVKLKHRNYSSSKLIKTLMFNQTSSQNFIEKNTCQEVMEGALEKKQLKKYCKNKFKVPKEQQKHLIKRKNASLNLLKKEERTKQSDISRTSQIKNNEIVILNREQRASSSLGKQFHSQQTISAKRRFQLIRLNKNNKLKLQIKHQNLKANIKLPDVSFQRALDIPKNIQTEKKMVKNDEIKSENVLGHGLRKSSSNKIKFLVKNPFERHIRQQQALQQQQNQLNIGDLAQFKQSQIIQNLDESLVSTNQQQLSELLAMI